MKYGNAYRILLLLLCAGFLTLVFMKIFGVRERNETSGNHRDIPYTQEDLTEAGVRNKESNAESGTVEDTPNAYPDMGQAVPEDQLSAEAITISPDEPVTTCYFTNSEHVIDAVLPLYAQERLTDCMQTWLNEHGMGDTKELTCVDGSCREDGTRIVFQVLAGKRITCIYDKQTRTWTFKAG